jgi:alanyl-tRNA synthetase
VPDATQSKIKANEWASAVLQVVEGKGGGKAGIAQGQGAAVAKLSEALSVAEQFAKMRL